MYNFYPLDFDVLLLKRDSAKTTKAVSKQEKIPGAQFSVSFFQLPAVKKDTENWAAVTSLRTFINSSAFKTYLFLLCV